MEKVHREILRKLRVYVVRNLTSLEEILDILESNKIISDNQRLLVLSGAIPADQIRKFLDIIVRCGPNAFESFKLALLETNQISILDKIRSLESESSLSGSEKNSIYTSLDPPNAIMLPDKHVRRHPLEPYSITSTPRGYVLIINIEEYDPLSGIPSRRGSTHDAIKLQSLFEDFGYNVSILANLNAYELKNAVAEFASRPEHKNVDAAGLFILSHGLEHHIVASDGLHVSVNHLVNYFSNPNSPYLAGKPKLVVIQACRGDLRNHLGSIKSDNVDASSLTSEVSLDPASWLSLPHMTDCVIVYSTLPGFVSWRSESDGSWYIRNFVDVFRSHGDCLHILDLLTEVNKRLVSESTVQALKQISQPVTTLTKPFYLSTATK